MVTVIVPVVAPHALGGLAVTTGAGGTVGAAVMVTPTAGEVHPVAFLTVTL